jgi:hypothetical protein
VADVAVVPPKETVAPNVKFTPVIVTDVPPSIGPEPGKTGEIDGPVVYAYAAAFFPV